MQIQNSKFKIQSWSSKFKVISLFLNFALLTIILHFALLTFNWSKATAQTPPNEAAQVLRVSPIIINVPLSPGQVYPHEVTIENLTDNPLPLHASLSDFQTTGEEGGYIFAETHNNPLLSWITLSDTELILNPKEKKTIQATITTPQSIPLGGYYGMLFFEVIPLTEVLGGTQVVPKIGVLLLANVGVPDPNAKNAEILTFTTGLFHDTTQLPLLLRVKNISLHYFTAKPILTISPLIPLLQNKEDIHYLEEKIVFQGNVRRWEEALTLKDASPNIYKASLKVSTGNGQVVTEEKYFVIFPLMKAVVGIIILAVILFIIRKRKRLGKAIRALIK